MKKFLIILYIFIFVALAYYVITLFINRSHSDISTQEEKEIGTSIEVPIEDPIESPTDNLTTSEPTNTFDNTQENAAYTITREDCNNECATIEDVEKKSYCNQICGFTNTTTTETCDDLSGLDKDYCLKNKAIKDKNLQKCTEIQDSGIKKQCQNRISEDFIDEIM